MNSYVGGSDQFAPDEPEWQFLEKEEGSSAGQPRNAPEEQANVPSREELAENCKDLIGSGQVLERYGEALRSSGKFAGSVAVVMVIVLAIVSRLLDKPVSLLIRGESSAGKSYAMKCATELMAPDSIYALTAMSEKALAYGQEDLSHRMMVLYEDDALGGGTITYLMRSLLSEGRIEYEFVDFENGRGTTKIEREGPTGLITSTPGKVDYELGTRMLSLNVDASPEATRAILASAALIAEGGREDLDLSEFHEFDHWLRAGPSRVVIQFASKIAQACDATAVRMRRDLTAVFGLVSAHALIHQAHRDRDEEGAVIATPDDYRAVYDLVADSIAQAAGATVPAGVRRLVEAMKERGGDHVPIPLSLVAEHLGLHRSTISRDAKAALTLGFIRPGVQTDSRKLFVLDDPLPEDRSVLPSPESLDLD
ncbi:MAG TPA: hypothetical protein VFP23_07530 [Solirubrobacterales bacterium]|nr:hypothetical protein [Solirubrobacterales bacterium]